VSSAMNSALREARRVRLCVLERLKVRCGLSKGTYPDVFINFRRAIHRLPSANNVMICALFFTSRR